jgi:hypothetical protein
MNLAKADRRTNNPFHHHREVDSIFKAYEDTAMLLRDFDFRQRVLSVAKRAFGEKSLHHWCELQRHSPYLTTMHRRFIYDTLGYIYSGRREVSVDSWMNLIEARDITDVDTRVVYDPSGYFNLKHNDSMRASSLRPQEVPPDLNGAICSWVSQTDGFKDLVYTLYIIFGKQCEYTPV